FSADGGRVVTASKDKTARVWDALTGKPLSPPLEHPSPVTDAAFAPQGAAQGNSIITVCADGSVRIWLLKQLSTGADDLKQFAEMFAAARLDETGAVMPLSAEEYQQRFSRLSALPALSAG